MAEGIEEVTGRLETLLTDAATGRTEATITQALIQAGAYAADLTPVDTSALINSQGRDVQPMGNGWRGTLFYGAEYAKWVHEAEGVMLGRGVLRDPFEPGRGAFWDPNGQPGFLAKGMERMAREDLENIILGNYGV